MVLTGKRITLAVVLVTCLFFVTPYGIAQTKPRAEWTGGGEPDDKISLSETLTLDQAFKLINDITIKQGKAIIDNSEKSGKISVEIVNLQWRRALELICKKNQLEYEEGANYLRIYNPLVKEAKAGKEVDIIDASNREVIIEAVFFEADKNALREIGVNWSTISSGQVLASVVQSTDSNVSNNNVFTLSASKQVNKTLSVSGIVKTFENKGKGTIIANPQLRVRAGKQGYVQVGTDFSIKTKDFAGNTIDNFVSAGTIMQVVPMVITDNDLTFIHLKIDVERSSGNVSSLTTTIDKTKASTSLLLLPGEEAALGGLSTTEKIHYRIGIPFLKDLPWWVFGIRYLAGYERESTIDKELIILLKVDLEPDLKTRITNYKNEHGLQETRSKFKRNRDELINESEKSGK